MNIPNHRQCFHQIMAGKPAPWIPNYELGCWGQTVQRWWQQRVMKTVSVRGE